MNGSSLEKEEGEGLEISAERSAPRRMKDADGRVALVTGASSGIGRACAEHLARSGFRVYGTSRRAAALPPAGIQAGEAFGPRFSMLRMDVTDAQSIDDGVGWILQREGRLDILVNNAGMGIAGPIESTSLEEAKKQFEVNFFGVFGLCRAVLPTLRRQGGGYIINIGSIGGAIAIPYQAFYSASKFALEGLSEALRLEVGPLGVRVVVVEPGDHKTRFTENRQPIARANEESIYSRPFRSALTRMMEDEQAGPDPDKIACLVHRIVDTRSPRLRYTVGKAEQRGAVWIKRLLPYSVLERGIRRYYRL